MGSLVAGQVNETGLAYKRNRYYDPQSGKFTQEDPIGLAGGMNEYGYANGDPVDGRDPFGLDPCKASSAWTECIAQGIANWGAQQGGAIGTIAVNAGAALNAGLEASGINGAASAGDAIGNGRVVEGGVGLAMTLAVPGEGGAVRDAAEGLAAHIGENSVTVQLENGFKRVDLVGPAHAGVPTPHVHMYEVHTNPVTGASNLKKTFGGAATMQDIIDAARAAGHP
jgi:RHS repeat-associated protein